MIKIMFVCLGNICRSTMAEYVLKDMVQKLGIADEFYITSSATSREEIGNPVHYGTRSKLREEGIYCGDHRAIQLTKADLENYDYIIGMDSANIRNITRIFGTESDKVSRLLDFTSNCRDIADPWYTGNFDETFADVTEGCSALLKVLKKTK